MAAWLDAYTPENVMTYVILPILLHLVVLWVPSTLLLWAETRFGDSVRRFKVQPDKEDVLDERKFAKAVRAVLENQLVWNTVLSLATLPLFASRIQPLSESTWPSLPTFLWQLAFFVLCEEVFFYYSHALMHQRPLYKLIHKQHHEWTAPIGMVCIYAHPVEHLLSNLAPVVAGPLILGSSWHMLVLWQSIAVLSTTVSHSGFHFPFLPSPERHDFHHARFNQCYGVLGWLDYLHGTDKVFRASVQAKRHHTILQWASARELHPDGAKRPQ